MLAVRTPRVSAAAWAHAELGTSEVDDPGNLDVSHPIVMPMRPRATFRRWPQQRVLPIHFYVQMPRLAFRELSARDFDSDMSQRRVGNFIAPLGSVDCVF